jgi:hypothetical protein
MSTRSRHNSTRSVHPEPADFSLSLKNVKEKKAAYEFQKNFSTFLDNKITVSLKQNPQNKIVLNLGKYEELNKDSNRFPLYLFKNGNIKFTQSPIGTFTITEINVITLSDYKDGDYVVTTNTDAERYSSDKYNFEKIRDNKKVRMFSSLLSKFRAGKSRRQSKNIKHQRKTVSRRGRCHD